MAGYLGNVPVPQATQTRDRFVATASQTTFATSGYTAGYLDVFLNGVKLDTTDFTAINGSDVVLVSGAASGDVVEVVAYSTFEVLNQTFSGDTHVTGKFTVDGNVGIGTSSPSEKLEVNGVLQIKTASSVHPAMRFVEGTTTRGYIGSGDWAINGLNDDDLGVSAAGTGDLVLGTSSGSERMRIDSAGRVHINDTQRYAQLTVREEDAAGDWNRRTMLLEHNDGSGVGTPAIAFHAEQNSKAGILKFYGPTNQFEFRNSNDTAFYSVRASAFLVSSDYRLKENIAPLEGAIDRIKQLPVHRFNFIDNPDVTVDGYLAHELAEVIPEAVTGEKDKVATLTKVIEPAVLDDEGNEITPAVTEEFEEPIYQGVDQAKVTPLLVAALQEAIARIETLEAEVATLKSGS